MKGHTKLSRMSFLKWSLLYGKHSTAQRAHDRVVYDGLEPRDLEGEEREKARETFGDVEVIPASARRVSVQNKGRGIGGTQRAAEFQALNALTLELDYGADELGYVFFIGPKLRHGRVGLRFALAALKHHGANVVDEGADGFTLVRHDGRRIRFEAIAASRGGDNLRGVHIVGCTMTEAAFFYDASGVANGEGIYSAALPRLVKGGMLIIESTPWAESGIHHDEFKANWERPTRAIAANCPTALMRDDPESLAMVQAEYERDPETARRELGAEFMPRGSNTYLDAYALERCAVSSLPLLISGPHDAWEIYAGYDPAYRSDEAAGAIIRSRRDGQEIEVVEVFSRVPERGKPLVPSQVDTAFAERVLAHGGRELTTDQHYVESVREHVQALGLSLTEAPGGNSGKCAVYSAAREAIHGDRVRWSAGHKRLTRQLREVVSKPLPGGLMAISSPRRRGDHGDGASALVLAVWAASSPSPATRFVRAMRAAAARSAQANSTNDTWHDCRNQT